MGRLADFASKDLKRKRLAMKADGGYRPPGTAAAAPAQRDSFSKPQQQFPKPQMPSFSGMVPGVAPPKLPMGFEQPTQVESPQSDDSSGMDLDALRIEAEEEWQEIRNAFSILEDHFGEDFQALGPEFSSPIQTPFGTALQYRTYGIAGIWMNFYMALIACHRAHPSMPPAAMMAAGLAARQTASFANELGRIAAGIAPDCSTTQQVSPGVGAALIESSTCLFVAGVQYQNAAQRAWTVDRLRDIARLTGWQTALAIATGCETSWVKIGELGRGPPYSRTSEERVVPDIWNSGRRVDRAIEASKANEERRLVIPKADRIHYALGVLGVEEDFEHLDLDNDERGS
ncbi:hypothetical protein D0Z07_4259 [Hyphodiscus hymeniophilus]|uniref:Uncharacterized protein n=1 Tax=Hyphodiscus hymeniophilus TaxID=353542 RepID=A0A9P6VL07_9HELO|nr:hypothetical protein D0Z07_4259 [Hyphodiscus hymeniophilus]